MCAFAVEARAVPFVASFRVDNITGITAIILLYMLALTARNEKMALFR